MRQTVLPRMPFPQSWELNHSATILTNWYSGNLLPQECKGKFVL